MKKYLPNGITALRVVFTLLSAAMLTGRLAQNLPPPAAWYGVLAVIWLSDLSDGAAARKLKAESRFGGFLDVAVDSLFIFSSLAIFNFYEVVPVWFTAVVLADFLAFLATSRFLVRWKPAFFRKSFVFDKAGRAAAVLYYLLPAAAGAVFASSDGNLQILFYALLGFSAFLSAVSVASRLGLCLSALREGKTCRVEQA